MTDDREPPRRFLDLVVARSVLAVALTAVSLVLFLHEAKLSLMPMVMALLLITKGKSIVDRKAPPIAFLVMVPMIAVIVVVALGRA
ncbi:hypothetical protein EDF46_1144 [Frondihabitans sp. PhB188]|uniref:hypothetical protein n=1 Tax=Frondihabitans sp. PhB188 TaxID=2485200 RepID=UPI000F48EA35|nr:hypothetical protein [Frondihabitans sp. PhB188]ROQ39512.1 hypothetical protein EDF46_1144 [Frondihabitans sp. PhB188]